MPPAPIVNGVEFAWHSGGSVALFVTVFNAAGRYQIRSVQSGTDVVVLIIRRPVGGDFVFQVRPDPGDDILVSQAQSNGFPSPYNDFKQVRNLVNVTFQPAA